MDRESEIQIWRRDGERFGWKMPRAPSWKRLPVIRHIRAMRLRIQIELWYAAGPGSIGLRSGYDNWVLFGIRRGMERPES